MLPRTPASKPPTPTKSPEMKSNSSYCIEGVCLSERGHNLIKSLFVEQQITRKKRRKLATTVHDKEAGIMATIESVVAGGSAGKCLFYITRLSSSVLGCCGCCICKIMKGLYYVVKVFFLFFF